MRMERVKRFFAFQQKIRLNAVAVFCHDFHGRKSRSLRARERNTPASPTAKPKIKALLQSASTSFADDETIIKMNIFSKIGKTTVEKIFTEAF